MSARFLTLTCACGWETSGTEEEVVAAAQEHGRTVHNMETSRDEVLALAKVTANESVDHYAGGGIRNRGFVLDDEMHGAWEFFRKDGTLMRSGSFDRGKQIGLWRTFDRNGRVVKETRFPDA